MDPLALLIDEYDYHSRKVIKAVSGERYVGVMLEDGQIGVCVNLTGEAKFLPTKPDLKCLNSRIWLTAYFNALKNFSQPQLLDGDIFQIVDFERYNNIVMIGFFKPLYQKLISLGKNIIFFDFRDIEGKAPEESKPYYLSKADIVIISSTTIANNTLDEILSFSVKAKKYLLGPSSIFDSKFFNIGIDGIFGTLFRKNDIRILEIIAQGGGTRDFQKLGIKKYLFNDSLGKKIQ